jgi:hypothetical protein
MGERSLLVRKTATQHKRPSMAWVINMRKATCMLAPPSPAPNVLASAALSRSSTAEPRGPGSPDTAISF